MSRIFYTAYVRPPEEPPIDPGKRITELSGYIPAQAQIEALINAGERLNDYRLEMYGPDAEISDGASVAAIYTDSVGLAQKANDTTAALKAANDEAEAKIAADFAEAQAQALTEHEELLKLRAASSSPTDPSV
nr:MAG: hypothetical protein [Microviridae sp.]